MKVLTLLVICFSILIISSCSVEATKSDEVEKPNKIANQNPKQEIKLIPETYKNEQLIWKGESGDYHIYWTEKDIYVEKDGQSEKLFTGFAKKYYDINFKYETEYSEKLNKYIKTNKLNDCLISIHGEITSLVGNYLTLDIEEYYMCGIPQYYTHWVVFDLENLDKIKFVKNTKGSYATGVGVKITDVFEDKKILAELLKNSEIKESIDVIENDFEPKSTLELLNWFQNKEQKYQKSEYDKEPFEFEDIAFENHSYSLLNRRALSEFKFQKIEEDLVLVQIALIPWGKRHGNSAVKIKLNIPKKYKQDFVLAKSKKRGFICASFNNSSVIDFENGKESE